MKNVRLLLLSLLLTCSMVASAHSGTELRRPISPEQPAWIIHIDVWNYADPQKIIDLVPEDVRPFVIFNIATSSSDDKSANGPAIYDSWMKVCAQNRVWTMIQCSSGAMNRMPDDGSTEAYEQYFKDYSNFLGFNFAEQFWGYGSDGNVSFPERLQLFADLLPVCHEYGGYLAVSFTDSYYNASKMPLAYLKRNEQMRMFLESDPEHFLCFEKYTLKKNFFDIESNCFGMWLGGYAGQYGIRFDSSGWLAASDVTDQTKGGADFVRAAGAIPVVEHTLLTGQTIMDGPELTWTECTQEQNSKTVDGYTSRQWGIFPQFENISLDIFRKVIDGSFRIPSKTEVLKRTKVCVVNDITKNLDNEDERNSYVTPEKLFDNLYRSPSDQNGGPNHWINNRWWMKTTGRYPTIPQVYKDVEGLTGFKKSAFDKTAFDTWMNENFPQEYSGDIYAGRQENVWVTYNPYQYDEKTEDGYRICSTSTQRAEGVVPFQYNSCESMTLNYAPYSLGVVSEYADKVAIYLTNYQTTGTVSEDVIKIKGASGQPTVTWKDRGNHVESSVETTWAEDVLTVIVKHNGPLDIDIDCAGTASGRKTIAAQTTQIQKPALPAAYEGVLQYEAEVADAKNTTIRKTGYNQGHDGFMGQGFAEMKNGQSALRFKVQVPEAGYYLMTLCYLTDGDGSVTVNEKSNLDLAKSSGWTTASTIIQLDEQDQYVVIQNKGAVKTVVDYIQLKKYKAIAFAPDANGEYRVNLSDMIANGSISIDAATGVVTQAANNKTGALSIFLDHADFTEVVSVKVSYEGDGDIFNYLVITDNQGNSVNPQGTKGAFWSSRYNLNYVDYQLAEASRKICRLSWVASEQVTGSRTMTIKEILVKTTKATSIEPLSVESGSCQYYDLKGRLVVNPRQGIYIVKQSNGQTTKQITK